MSTAKHKEEAIEAIIEAPAADSTVTTQQQIASMSNTVEESVNSVIKLIIIIIINFIYVVFSKLKNTLHLTSRASESKDTHLWLYLLEIFWYVGVRIFS